MKRQKQDEDELKREEAIKMNRKMEQEKFDYIKKLRLSEEKDRISLYLDKIKQEKKKEKKKLENIIDVINKINEDIKKIK